MNALWKLLLFGAGIYLLVLTLVYFRQSSMIYFPGMPGRELIATPQRIGLAYEDVNLVTEDGIELHGWFIPHSAPRGALLFFHGNAGNISHRLDSIEIFHRLGLDLLIIDYRGYGQSGGTPGEQGTYRDAQAAWKYLTENRGIDASKIVVFGRSLGASVAAWLASRQRPAALIVESGFASVRSLGSRIYPFLPVKWLSRFDYDTRGHVGAISCPLLVLHSRGDEIIPYAEGREIFDAASVEKRFFDMRGGHNDGFLRSGANYVEALESFIRDSLERP